MALLACAPLAHAQVYRCIGAHGEPVYSGQPCDGTPVGAQRDAAAGQARIFGNVCPATPEALRRAINDAFQDHDVNLMAGLILWRGVSQGSARATLRSLADWLDQPLAGIASVFAIVPPSTGYGPEPPYSAGAPAAVATSAPPPVPIGFQVSTGGGNGGTRDFGITESGGCWWLTF